MTNPIDTINVDTIYPRSIRKILPNPGSKNIYVFLGFFLAAGKRMLFSISL